MREPFNVEETNLDCSYCKKSAVYKKYWRDDFINQFSVKSLPSRYVSCEMHRGYAVRTIEIFDIVKNFIRTYGNGCNIIVYGCGFDTLYWRLSQLDDIKNKHFKIYDIDLSVVIYSKIKSIRSSKLLSNFLDESVDQNKNSRGLLNSNKYSCFVANICSTDQLKNILDSLNFNYNLPTLFIAECVLIYLLPEKMLELLKFSYKLVEVSVFLEYDPLILNDTFSKVMLENLNILNIDFSGRDLCFSNEKHIYKFVNSGWCKSNIVLKNMNLIYNNPKYNYIKNIEPLDESYLLEDLLNHYCLCLAYKNIDSNTINSKIWKNV